MKEWGKWAVGMVNVNGMGYMSVVQGEGIMVSLIDIKYE